MGVIVDYFMAITDAGDYRLHLRHHPPRPVIRQLQGQVLRPVTLAGNQPEHLEFLPYPFLAAWVRQAVTMNPHR